MFFYLDTDKAQLHEPGNSLTCYIDPVSEDASHLMLLEDGLLQLPELQRFADDLGVACEDDGSVDASDQTHQNI